jgi:hypothetical protein
MQAWALLLGALITVALVAAGDSLLRGLLPPLYAQGSAAAATVHFTALSVAAFAVARVGPPTGYLVPVLLGVLRLVFHIACYAVNRWGGLGDLGGTLFVGGGEFVLGALGVLLACAAFLLGSSLRFWPDECVLARRRAPRPLSALLILAVVAVSVLALTLLTFPPIGNQSLGSGVRS